MTLLIAGLALFVGLHLLPTMPAMRQAVIDRIGFDRYRGLFSLLALIGLGMMIMGKLGAEYVHFYTPVSWGREFALWLMPLALMLLVSAYLPGHTRRVLGHPMLLGLAVWGVAHLVSNGDTASVLLFGGWTAFSALNIASHRWRPATPDREGRLWADGVALGLAAASYVLILYLHGLAGLPVVHWTETL